MKERIRFTGSYEESDNFTVKVPKEDQAEAIKLENEQKLRKLGPQTVLEQIKTDTDTLLEKYGVEAVTAYLKATQELIAKLRSRELKKIKHKLDQAIISSLLTLVATGSRDSNLLRYFKIRYKKDGKIDDIKWNSTLMPYEE